MRKWHDRDVIRAGPDEEGELEARGSGSGARTNTPVADAPRFSRGH